MSLPFIVNKIVHTTKNANIKDFGRHSAGNKGYRGARKRRPHTRTKSSRSACTCMARDFLVATIRVWMATSCSIGHYDYYDQMTATRTQNGVVALLTRTRAGPLMNYRYYLPVCAGESHHKWSRSAFEECTRNNRMRDQDHGEEIGNLSDFPRNQFSTLNLNIGNDISFRRK